MEKRGIIDSDTPPMTEEAVKTPGNIIVKDSEDPRKKAAEQASQRVVGRAVDKSVKSPRSAQG